MYFLAMDWSDPSFALRCDTQKKPHSVFPELLGKGPESVMKTKHQDKL